MKKVIFIWLCTVSSFIFVAESNVTKCFSAKRDQLPAVLTTAAFYSSLFSINTGYSVSKKQMSRVYGQGGKTVIGFTSVKPSKALGVVVRTAGTLMQPSKRK
ncbi:hypothetical protein HYV11_04055 [Candidatus Dependentiae bacterium]|nr:hypothetical protein [Candidatus Dependentiae bacterium]